MAWPLLGGPIRGRTLPGPPWVPAAVLLGLVAVSLLPVGRDYDPGGIALPDAFLDAPSAATRATTDSAVAVLAAARTSLGPLRVDNSVAALAPFAFMHNEIAGWGETVPHTVVFLANGFDAASLRAAPGLTARYRIPGTELRIATDRPDAVKALGIPLEASETL